MSETLHSSRVIRFGIFEVDLQSGELRKSGLKLKLTGQPFQVLAILLEHPGELVTREELRKRLWPDTFVDVEHNLNTAINKIRETLGDSAENPRFVETLARRGYRFIGPTEQPSPTQVIVTVTEANQEKTPRRMSRRSVWAAMTALVIVCVFLALGLRWMNYLNRPPRVLAYRQLTHDRKDKGGGFATDGARVYFSEWDTGLMQVSTAGGEAARVSSPFDYFELLELSPDKTELLGVARKDSNAPDMPLWVLSLASGQARRVGNLEGHAGAWSPDGQRIAYATGNDYAGGSDIYVATKDGNDARKLTRVENGYVWTMHWSPDGRTLRMGGMYYPQSQCRVWDISDNLTELRNVALPTEAGCWYNWIAGGRYSLMQVPTKAVGSLENRSSKWQVGVLREKPSFFPWAMHKLVSLTTGPMNFWNLVGSPDGKRIFAIGFVSQGELLRYDLKSQRLEPYLAGISADQLGFSRDGKWVAYVTYPEGVLWRSRVDGSERLQLTTPPLIAGVPDWAPDSTRIAFSGVLPGGPWRTYVVSAQGGELKMISKTEEGEVNPTWAPDGDSLVFGGFQHAARRVSSIDLRTGRVSTVSGSEGLRSPRVSPDGRFIVALDALSDSKFFLYDQQTQKWSPLVESNTLGVGWPEWSSDSRYMYFSNWAEAGTHYLYRVRIADHKLERVAGVEVPEGLAGFWANWMIAGPDGSPILLRDASTQEIYAFDVDLP